MSKRKAEVLLLVIVMAISTSYLLMKLGAEDLGRFNVIALRFAIAFTFLAIIFRHRLAHLDALTFKVGALLGTLMFLVLAAQVLGLRTVSTSSAGFLASVTVIIVPLLQMIGCGHAPSKPAVIGGAITMAGVASLVCGSLVRSGAGIDVGVGVGMLLFLLGAVFYSIHIIVVDRFAGRVDLLSAGTVEMGVTAVLGAVGMLIFEVPQIPQSPAEWGIVLALALVCSVCGLAVEPNVQRYTSPERYGLIYSLCPLFACLWGVLFMHETLGVLSMVGIVLMLAGTLCQQGGIHMPTGVLDRRRAPQKVGGRLSYTD